MSERAQSTVLPPSSATSHGKIRTENSELLNLLRQKTSDSSGHINHTPSRESLHHAADNNLTRPQASAGRRLVDVDNNLQVSTAPSQLEPPAQPNVDPALTNTETARDIEDNVESHSDSQIIVPPLNLETNRNSETYYSSSANQTAKDNGQLTTDSDLVKSGVERNKYLHEILVDPSQNLPQVDVSSDPTLHVSRKNSVSSVKSHLSNTSAPVLSSRSVALHGDGNNNSVLHDHKTEETVQNDSGNSENKTASFQDLQTARSGNFEVNPTQRSLVLDSALHVLPTPEQSAPVTGRQTYDVPSPISTQIPNIDSLSNFSNPDDREEKPVPRSRSSKQGSTLTSRSIPVPGQGAISPRQSATTRLTSSRDQSATARSSSGVYAVANPAVLVAQGITPAPNQQSVQFTPRPQPRSKQESFVDSLEAPSKETGEVDKRDETKDRKKSAVSFRDGRDQVNSQPINDPYTGAESPTPGSEPDWDSPRVQDRLPTPHPTSDNYRFSPTQPVWEKEEQEEQKSLQTLDISEPTKSSTEAPNDHSNRSESPSTALSPTPLDENDRKVDSALPIPGGSASSEARVARTDSLPTVQKVYVDSPTFTREEEDEYRFVESRLGEIQDDVEETLRKLDEETEKQRKIRKQLEEQMATMYAPAYEDQGNVQPYSRNTQYGEPPRGNMGSYSNIRNQEDRSYQEPRRENMGSYSTLRNEEKNSYGAPRRESMGSYTNGRNDDRNPYTEQRRENMGSYASVRNDDRQSYGDPRRENMGSYASLRNDDRQSYGDPRRENMGSYTSLRNDDRNSYGDPRRENMGSYTSLRNDDRNSYGEPRRENIGSYPSVKNEDRNSYGERNTNGAYQPARNEDRQSYDEPRRDDMDSYTSVQPDDRKSNGVPNRENMGSYSNVHQENGYNQGTYNPPPRQPESYGQNEVVENQGYGGRGRDDDRYEDRDFDPQGNRNRFENQDQQPESERYNPPSHVQNMNYEPHDEDLRREAEYQEGLKMRISESGKKDMEIQIPRLPLESEQFRDSLEEDNFRDWDNPPPNPFANEGGIPHQQEKHEHLEKHEHFEESKVPPFVDENDTARMEFLHPKSPRYDFIEMNKIDYGKPHEKSYREIKHVREEESKKLEKVFIHPRLPQKKKPVKPGLKSAPSKFQVNSPIEEMDPEDPAQALWAKRSAQLKKKDTKSSSGHSNKHKGLQRNQSDSRLVRPAGQGGTFTYKNNSQVVYGSPTRNHFLEPMENRPAPPHIPRAEPQYTTNSEPINFPDRQSDHQSPPLRSRPLDLKPITQEIVTEDGQRISVDINLKVLSPPPGSGTGAPHTLQAEVHPKDVNRRPTGMQYQMEENYPSPEQDPQQHHNYNQDTRYDQENVVPGGGEQVQHSDDTYRMSPYSKVPPINLTEEELDRQLAELEQNGYTAMYKQYKNKPQGEKPWYQVYTIKDYRKMKNEVRLTQAPLGPDLDNETYKEKLEKRHKQFEYARMVMEKNRQQLDVKKPPAHPKKEEEKPTKRKTAIDYSKNIPKPNVKPRPNQYNSYEVAAQLSPAAKRSGPPSPTQTVDVIDLQKLKNRHDQEKQNVASIRQNMETVPQKA